MNIGYFFRILWMRRNLVLATTLAALAAAVVIVMVVPPRYEASSRVMLDTFKPDPVTGEVMSSQYARAYVATQIEIIKDYRVAGRVVDTFGWATSPELAAQYQAQTEGREGDASFRRWLADIIINGTEVSLIEGSNILEITYTSDNPETVAKVADALRVAYQDEVRSARQEGARTTSEWFTNQTQKLRTQLATAEKKLTDFERANGVIISEDGRDAETARLAAMSQMAETPQMPSFSAPVPVTSPSQAQLAQIDAAIATSMSTLGPNHPRIQALRQQRAAVASAASQELAAARAAAQAGSGGPRGPSVGQLFSAQQQKVLAQRGKVAEAQQLAVDVAVLREQVSNSAKKAAEQQQQAESTETGLSFLGNAVTPKSAEFPNTPLVIIGALLIGFGIGTGLSILIELLRRRVRSPSDLTFDGVPLLGMAQFGEKAPRQSLGGFFQRLLPSPSAH